MVYNLVPAFLRRSGPDPWPYDDGSTPPDAVGVLIDATIFALVCAMWAMFVWSFATTGSGGALAGALATPWLYRFPFMLGGGR